MQWFSNCDPLEQQRAVVLDAKWLQSCPTLCDPIDGILQARILEWVAISFSNARQWKVKVKSLSHVWLLATPWTAAYQAPPSMGVSRQEYWSGLPLPSPWFLCHWECWNRILFAFRASTDMYTLPEAIVLSSLWLFCSFSFFFLRFCLPL